jgi:thiamine kinase-like enzyme
MPPQIDVPFVAALDDAEANEHWILLRDVTSELKAFRSPTELAELHRHYSIALDQLALMHATWEKPDRQAWLKKLSWLVPDSARLARGSAVARYLEQAPLGRSESARIESIHDWIENARIKPAREAFYQTLTSSDATMWKRHECRRRTLIAKFAEFPTTLVHGDVYPLNIGLRLVDGDDRVILIDWEWIGNGCGALDAAKLLAVGATAAHPDFDSRSLACHYFDRYVAHGGTLFNFASWMRAYELAEVYHALIVHPLATGWSILDSTEHEAYLKAKTPWLAGLIARHLG